MEIDTTPCANNPSLRTEFTDPTRVDKRPSLPCPLTSPAVIESTSRALVPFTGRFPILLPDCKPGSGGLPGRLVDVDVDEDKKREREHKKRSKNWTRSETVVLIRLRTDLAPRFGKAGRKNELWDQIADALQKEQICRDSQQCRDKWEKLMAGYKDVRDGLKGRADYPFYDELHPLLSGMPLRRDRERQEAEMEAGDRRALDFRTDGSRWESSKSVSAKNLDQEGAFQVSATGDRTTGEEDEAPEERAHGRKRKRGPELMAATDHHTVQTLVEKIMSQQQRFCRELLDKMERKEQLREQMRQERENKWRAEERAQRVVFTEAMIVLTQKLGADRVSQAGIAGPLVCSPVGNQGPKKRSKNWKRAEVLQLIKLRGEMESKFAKCVRRAGLWEELAEMLGGQGIQRDGKQCREKWDKLMSEHKDVLDGKREQGDSPYFTELTAIVGGRPGEAG